MANESGDHFIESRLDHELAGAGLSKPDRALCQELVYGVTRWKRTLDWLIEQKTSHRPEKLGLTILLHLGLYQMFWLDRIPDHAAVHESVELAKNLGYHSQAGFINAILRAYTREKEPAKLRLAALKAGQPGLGFSHPDWLCARWLDRWGAENLSRLLEWNNAPAPIFARVNTLKTTAAALLEAWTAEGLSWREIKFDWVEPGLVYELDSPPSLTELRSFRDGGFYVQDPSTLLAVRELAPEPGMQVLDLCAAPGGKTTYIAQLMSNKGRILACDIDGNRLSLLRENCARLGVVCVENSRIGEAMASMSSPLFDRVLVDAPCSNTGVLRRRIEGRWRISAEEIARLVKEQQTLLQSAATQLRPGGILVYSTCSLEAEENEGVVQAFLREHGDFRLVSERTLLPFQEGADGAFVAVMRRI